MSFFHIQIITFFFQIVKYVLTVGNFEILKTPEEKIKLLINATAMRQLRFVFDVVPSSLFSIHMNI